MTRPDQKSVITHFFCKASMWAGIALQDSCRGGQVVCCVWHRPGLGTLVLCVSIMVFCLSFLIYMKLFHFVTGSGKFWLQLRLFVWLQGSGPIFHEMLSGAAVRALFRSIPGIEQGNLLVFSWYDSYTQHAPGSMHLQWWGDMVVLTMSSSCQSCQIHLIQTEAHVSSAVWELHIKQSGLSAISSPLVSGTRSSS